MTDRPSLKKARLTWRKKMLQEGRCPICGEEAGGTVLCSLHQEAQRGHQARYRARRKQQTT